MSDASLWAIPAFNDNYIWVAQRDSFAVIVDPGDADPVEATLIDRDLELVAILVTHHHWDHTNGLADLVRNRNIPVYGPKMDVDRIPQITHGLQEGDVIDIQPIGLKLSVLEVPGHTLDHIAFVGEWSGNPLTFCGDTLFSGGCGRLFEGDPATMYDSLMKLAALPAETRVCCTHEYTLANLEFAQAVEPENDDLMEYRKKAVDLRANNQSTLPSSIALEKSINPFLRCHTEKVQAAAADQLGHRPSSDSETFAAIRAWKDNF